MKTSLRIIVFFLFSSVFFSCDKALDAAAIPYSSQLRANVNGSVIVTDKTNTTKSAVTGGTQLTITATMGASQVITLVVKNYTGAAGTFNVNGSSGTAIAAYNTGVAGSADVIGTAGNVVITNVMTLGIPNKAGVVVEGTFSYTAGSNSITTGTYSVFIDN